MQSGGACPLLFLLQVHFWFKCCKQSIDGDHNLPDGRVSGIAKAEPVGKTNIYIFIIY